MKQAIAKDLLSIKAVFLAAGGALHLGQRQSNPPYLLRHRLRSPTPPVRGRIESGLAELIREHYPDCEVLMGTSTAGIPTRRSSRTSWACPMGYVRSGAKEHGRGNRIEGRLEPGQKVVVVEDLISTGGSVLDTVGALREAGAEVLGIVSIFTYNMKKGLERMEEAGVKNASLTDFDALVEAAVREGYINPADAPRLIAFRDKPVRRTLDDRKEGEPCAT